jgi:hypothetical protein
MLRFLNAVVAAVFVGLISIPPIANAFGADGDDAEAENREPAPFPTFSLERDALTGFLPGFDKWFSDHFAFRSTLVEWHGITRYFWLGVSPNPAVGVARRGWLYYVDDGGLEDFTNEQPLTDDELQVWRDTVVRARKWTAARHIGYGFVIAPDKSTIYPELFPETAQRINHLSRADQIYTATADTGAAIDVRQALFGEKADIRLFQKTDTHWNARGAYVAYSTIIAALRLQVPSIPPPRPLSDFIEQRVQTEAMDLAGMIGLKHVLGEEDLRLVPREKRRYVVREPAGNIVEAGEARIVTEIPGSQLPRAVIFRDSFTSAMAPFLSDHFSRAVYLWRNDFAADEVEKEHPDVVLQEIVGRHVQWFVPSPELIPNP